MAAEARGTGPQIRPVDGNPGVSLTQRMAMLQGLHQSVPANKENMSVRQKIQAKIDSEMFFVPKKQDTKRFQPGHSVKVCGHSYYATHASVV